MNIKNEQNYIQLIGAREKNLKNININIPKGKITIFTGVSGSGKSSLVFDTIAAESQRQLNETFSSFIRHKLPHYGQPSIDSIENLSVAIIIDQKRIGDNSRSTVGTITDIYSLLRLLFSRIGKPFVGYSEAFSFNNPKGMCPKCEGLGKINTVNLNKLLDKEKSLNEGAILFPTFEPKGWRLNRYIHSGFFDNNKKLKEFTEKELSLLLYEKDIKVITDNPKWPKTSLYEGLIPRIERSFLKKEDGEALKYKKEILKITNKGTCPNCKGARLSNKILTCKINDKNIADCVNMQIIDLFEFLKTISSNPEVSVVIDNILNKLNHMISIDLGYLSLSRETPTLSGGESQRIKIIKQLGNSLTDLIYIFDEPSIGLHPHDINKINNILKLLRDKGNTVLIVEHDPDIIKIGDYVIDMGPEAGINGGEITYKGSLKGLVASNTLTGKTFNRKLELKENYRVINEYLTLKNISRNNIKNINVNIPKKVITVITGVAGSGKSSLINQALPKIYSDIIFIDQKQIHTSKRSNIATFTGIFDDIRKAFSKENNVKPALFSFNSEGACSKCNGLGVIYTDLAFMDTVVTVCEECLGKRFKQKILDYKLKNNKNINDVLNMTISESINFFDDKKIINILNKLNDVGLSYITLGQPLNTLSGGELQRLKLALKLEKKGEIYVLDEPTTGLHTSDIYKLIEILNILTNNGSTVILIEHNLDIISQADWIIDLGPFAGEKGGNIIFEGRVTDLINCDLSITGQYLKKYITKENFYE